MDRSWVYYSRYPIVLPVHGTVSIWGVAEEYERLSQERLPTFTEEEKKLIKVGSFDFIGINYSAARYMERMPVKSCGIVVDANKIEKPLYQLLLLLDESRKPFLG